MRGQHVSIRPISTADFAAWNRLWQDYLRFYRADLPEQTTLTTFERLVAQTGGAFGLVADDDDHELVGLAHLIFHTSTWSIQPYCYLEDLFVSPAARGTATATRLITAAYDEADRRGAARTYWHTQEYNSSARSLYDQLAHPTSFRVYER